MGSLSPYRLRIFIALLLSLVAALANAGHYVVTYSGGQFSGTGPSGAYTHPLAVASGYYGGEEFTPFRSDGTTSLSGPVTATLTWTPSTDPRPDSVILYEYADVSVDVDSGGMMTTAPTLGDPQQTATTDADGGEARLVRYSVVANPGATITVSYNPQAAASGYSIQGYCYGYYVAANFQVDAQVSTVALSGGTSQTAGDYLVGQQMTATLNVPFYLTPTTSGSTPARQWSIAASQTFRGVPVNGNPFKQFIFTTPGYRVDLTASDYAASSLVCCFAGKAQDTVSCAAHLAVPSGALPAGGLDVTASAMVAISSPTLSLIPNSQRGTSLGFTPGVNFLAPGSSGSSPNPGSLSLTDADDTDGTKPNPVGTAYRAGLTVPSEFVPANSDNNAFGGWVWVQLITEATYRTCGSSIKQTLQLIPDSAGDTQHGLDAGFPYAPVTTFDTQDVDTIDSDPAHPASNFKMYVANGKIGQTHDTPYETMPLTDAYSPLDASGKAIPAGFYLIDETFSVWQMYRPPGDGSQFVPVQSFRWHWTGGDGALWNGNAWVYQSATHGGVTQLAADTVWPSWTRIYQHSLPHYVTVP